jgi:hypothetical protein
MIKRFVAQTFFSSFLDVQFPHATPLLPRLMCIYSEIFFFHPQLPFLRRSLVDSNHKHIEPNIFHISVNAHSLLRIQIVHIPDPYFMRASDALLIPCMYSNDSCEREEIFKRPQTSAIFGNSVAFRTEVSVID